MNKPINQPITFQINESLHDDLKYFSKKENVSLFVTLLAAFKVILHRLNGQYDLGVATPNATFSSIMELRTKVNVNEPFDLLLQRTKENTILAHSQAGVRFEEIIKTSQSKSKSVKKPSYPFLFVLQNFAEEELNRDKFAENASKFDLVLSITQTSDYLQGSIIYDGDLYEENAVHRLAGHYKELLNSIVQQPQQLIGELPILTPEEHRVLIEFNDTAIDYPTSKTLIDLFEEQVEKSPGSTALIFKEEQLTYQQLNEKANQLAHYLKSKGIKNETLVPVCIERSAHMIITLLGILKAGGAYVPIDPEFPNERIKHILDDTKSGILVGSLASREKIRNITEGLEITTVDGDDQEEIGKLPVSNLQDRVLPGNLAYIIYTSGSTGKPKGVMVEHRSILNYLLNSKDKFINEDKNSSGTFIHLSYTFDASLKSIFTPLLSGKLIVISSQPLAYVFEDSNLHKYAPYDFIQLTPSHLDFFYAEYKDKSKKPITAKVSIGGDALFLKDLGYLIETAEDVEVVNEYGPTEATVACSNYAFNIQTTTKIPQRLPIGKPINNAQIYILNEFDQLVPIGVTGEICIGGVQVARGYLNRPDLTKKKFIANPFDNADPNKIYKTGDLGRWLPDGNIECLGRTDEQVKIRGYRIEPGEIEDTLIKSDLIKQVAVVAREDEENKKYLVAYIVPNGFFDKKEITSYLLSRLPHYMIPDVWVKLESLPLTANGKIDKNSLPEPSSAISITNQEQEHFEAPRTEEEKRVADIWQEVLGVEQIGLKDNFFQLGEPSILAIKVLRLVEELTGKYLPLSAIFENPTVEEFARQLKKTN